MIHENNNIKQSCSLHCFSFVGHTLIGAVTCASALLQVSLACCVGTHKGRFAVRAVSFISPAAYFRVLHNQWLLC